MDERVDVCAMINAAQATRVESWVRQAVELGARILAGGKREGAVVWPTIVEHVPRGARLDCDEVYGPVSPSRVRRSTRRSIAPTG